MTPAVLIERCTPGIDPNLSVHVSKDKNYVGNEITPDSAASLRRGHLEVASPTQLRAQCSGGSRVSPAEMGQEGLIALLLRQQEDMLKELRHQKEGLTLLQANKEDIAQAVLSSIKEQQRRLQQQQQQQQQQTLATSTAPPHHPRSRRSKKRRRSRRRNPRNSRPTEVNDTERGKTESLDELGDACLSMLAFRDDARGGMGTPPSDSHCLSSDEMVARDFPSLTPTTLIRQRVEKQTEHAEVSLDGLWLPSFTGSPSRLDTDDQPSPKGVAASTIVGARAGIGTTVLHTRWATPSTSIASYSALDQSCRAAVSPYRSKNRRSAGETKAFVKRRPVTVATYAQLCAKDDALGSDMAASVRDARRSGAVTAGAKPRQRGGYVNMHRGHIESSRAGAADGQRFHDRESRCGLGNRVSNNAPITGGGRASAGDSAGDTTTPVSKHTAAMLERSRALVAKAKASCAHAAQSTPSRHGKEDHSITSRSLRGEGENGGEGGENDGGDRTNATGDMASTILFPSLSPAVGYRPLSLPGSDFEGGTVPARSGATTPEVVLCQNPDTVDTAAFASGVDLHGSDYGGRHDNVETTLSDDASKGKGETSKAILVRKGTREMTILSSLDEGREDGCFGDTGAMSDPDPGRLASLEAGASLIHEVGVHGHDETGGFDEGVESEHCGDADFGIHHPIAPIAVVTEAQSDSTHADRAEGKPTEKDRRRLGTVAGGRNADGGGGNDESADLGSPAKLDTEWENEIAKNILSLYQTKLKMDMDRKKMAREEELGRHQRGYLTAEEEQDVLRQERQCRHPRHNPRSGQEAALFESTGNGGDRMDVHVPMATVKSLVSPQAVNGPRDTKRYTPVAASGTRERGRTRQLKNEDHGGGCGQTPGSLAAAKSDRRMIIGRDSRQRRPSTTFGDTSATGKPSQGGAVKIGDTTAGEARASKGRGGFRGSRAIAVPTRGGGEAVVMVPKRPRPIWFAGSGAIQAEWSALPGGARLARDLEGLEEQGRYSKYIAIVEGLLAAHLRADDQRGPSELVKRLWRQLVVTCTAFGVRGVENGRFERALELLKRAEILLSRQVLDKRSTLELRAFVSDAYGLYYMRRGKSSAALDFVQKAMKTHARMQDWAHVTKCHLHSSVVLSKLNRHDEALRCLGQVLSMVQDGKLDVGGNSPQKLCLVAICYHNMAVEQLILRHAGEACMSSQNARRLARLCLSYSNRWLHSFEGTHKLALAELARGLPPVEGGDDDRGDAGEQRMMLKRLTEELFS